MKMHILPRLLLLGGLIAFLLTATPAFNGEKASGEGKEQPAPKAEPEEKPSRPADTEKAEKPAEKKEKVEGYHVVYLNDGNEYWGRVDSIEDGIVRFTHVGGEKSEYKIENVKVITFQKKRRHHGIESADKLPDRRYDKWLESPFYDVAAALSQKGLPPQHIGQQLQRLAQRFNSLNLLKDVKCTLNKDGSAVIETRIVKFILKEDGKGEMLNYFTYRKDREKGELLYAITVDRQGKVYHIKDDAVNDEPLNNEVAEYDRLHRIKFGLPNAEVGSTMDFAYRVTIEKTDAVYPFISEMYFLSSVPTLEQRLTIKAWDQNRKLLDDYREDKFRAWPVLPGLPSQIIEAPNLKVMNSLSAQEGSERTYELGPIGGFVLDESQTPPSSHFAPRVIVGRESTWPEIGNAYQKALAARIQSALGAGAEAALATEIKNLGISEGLKGSKLAEAAYDRIARKMKYIDVTMAAYDYLPQNPLPLMKKDVANALDKAHIFYLVCRLNGIPANLVLVRHRSAGPVAENVPCIRQLSSPLVRIELEGKEIFCSFASKNLRMGQLSPDLQDTSGLLIDGADSKLITVPATAPEAQSVQNKLEVKVLENGDIEVTRVTTITGGAEAGIRTMRFSTEEKINKDIEASVGAIHPNCRYIGHRFVTPLDDFSGPLKIEYKYEISDYVVKGGDKLILLHFPELEYDAYEVAKDPEDRKMPIYFGSASQSLKEYHVVLPKGFKVRYVPENITGERESGDRGTFSYTAIFIISEKVLTFRDKTDVNGPQIGLDEYQSYKEAIENRARLAKEWIILEKEK
ncbi:MAG: DUF3857 domain-containing protein [Planctomycetota bacterium]